MRKRVLYLVLGLVFLSADGTAAGSNKDAKGLAGTWKLVGFEVKGTPQEFPALPRWVIKSDKVYYGGEELAALTVDAATMPRSIDLNFVKQKRVHEGIYSVEGDTLKICVSRITEGVKERPSSFTTEGKPDWRLLVFQREKAGADELEGVGGFVGIQLRVTKDKQVGIADVLKGMAAEKAGLQKDDILLKIGAADATGVQQTVDLVRQAKPGSELTIRVKRGEKEHDFRVKVGVPPFFLLDP